jgi:GlpG protein
MRFIGKFSDLHKAENFSKYLATQGIENRLEKNINKDWGSDDYGTVTASIWIVDEDQLDESKEAMARYHLDPEDISFKVEGPEPSPQQTHKATPIPPKSARKTLDAMGPITLYLLILCSLLFLFNQSNSPQLTKITEGLPYTPVLSSPLRKQMLFDYPKAYSYIDKLVALYGADRFETVQKLPPDGQALFQQYLDTPIWQGIYVYALEKFNPPKKPAAIGNFMEKIRSGEVWRTITPTLMHADIFHLIFNMLWLIILGRQMENRLTKTRYLLLMLIVGVVSNFAQYLVSGSNFIGYSGILCGMLAFIWVRQKEAPWEGYQMQQGTFSFMLFFVLAIVAIQSLSFILDAAGVAKFSVPIANTAHVVGGITGALLGKLSYFEMKSKVK